jgi:hypothetical protein
MAKFFLPEIMLEFASDQLPLPALYSSAVADRAEELGFQFPPTAKTLLPRATRDAPALGYKVLPVWVQVLEPML